MSQDASRHTRLAEARQARMGRPEVAAAYEQTRRRYELAEVVRLRREELGWSQRQLAERAGMSQPGVARFEAGGTTPTLPLLERLAEALGLTFNVSLSPRQRGSAPPVQPPTRPSGMARDSINLIATARRVHQLRQAMNKAERVHAAERENLEALLAEAERSGHQEDLTREITVARRVLAGDAAVLPDELSKARRRRRASNG